jgi:hypothetical protein
MRPYQRGSMERIRFKSRNMKLQHACQAKLNAHAANWSLGKITLDVGLALNEGVRAYRGRSRWPFLDFL